MIAPGIRDAGDSALLVEFDARIDPVVNSRVIGVANAIAAARIAGVRDVVPTYRSVAVHFDPLMTDVEQLREWIRGAAQVSPPARDGSLIEIPVAYGGENGPDLQDVAAFAGVPTQDVIDRHCGQQYRVFMLGFLPGFAYMGVVDESIAAPRKATPRTWIPAGAVGIAGRQTGIYPRPSPGGWQLIGRTAVNVFDLSRPQPSLFAPGDRVRFVPEDRTVQPRTPEPHISERRTTEPRTTEPRTLTVLRPGLLTTIQDSGRWGHQDRGVPVAGPMDSFAHRLANVLVGNSPGAATLEATLLGPELRFEQSAQIAVTGADLSASIDGASLPINRAYVCPAGSALRFAERRGGARTYIAVDGGINVRELLGSRATHVVSGLGGIDGRALIAGDRLPLSTSNGYELPRPMRHGYSEPTVNGGARLRIMRGPQDDHFHESAFDVLQRTRFTISSQSDRMGYRLVGSETSRPALADSPGPFGPGTMISDATFIGGIQIPPSGEPILLMVDRQTTGGYPQIATVITADLSLAGQLAPGDWIEFTLCPRAEAIAALREREEAFHAL